MSFFHASHSEHVETVMACNAKVFTVAASDKMLVFEWILPLTQLQNLERGLFKINILTFGERNLLPASGFFHFPLLSLLFQDVSGQVAVTGDASHLWVVLEFLYQLLVVVCGSFFSGWELWEMRLVSMLYITHVHTPVACSDVLKLDFLINQM